MSQQELWKRWHPLARSIAELMIARSEPDLTDDEVAGFERELAKIYDTKAFENAVRDILYLAAALEHEGATSAASLLFRMVESKPVIGALDRLSHNRAVDRMEVVGLSAKKFAAFSRAAESRSVAPVRETSAGTGRRMTARDLRAIPILV